LDKKDNPRIGSEKHDIIDEKINEPTEPSDENEILHKPESYHNDNTRKPALLEHQPNTSKPTV